MRSIVASHFAGLGTYYGIERIEFADGTSWDPAAITANAWYRGTTSAETITGSGYNDVIFGDLGNDTLQGAGGGDVYVYRSGDGADVINDPVWVIDYAYDGYGGYTRSADTTRAAPPARLRSTPRT